MDTESKDDSTRSSVSSLKSRFEQLATKEVKNGPDHTSQGGLVMRPSSGDIHRNEETKPRASIDGTHLAPTCQLTSAIDGRPGRTGSPQPPPRPKAQTTNRNLLNEQRQQCR